MPDRWLSAELSGDGKSEAAMRVRKDPPPRPPGQWLRVRPGKEMKAGLRESEEDCHGGWGAGTKTGSCGVKCVQRVSTKGHAGRKRKGGSEGAALTGDAEAADGTEKGS